jgi:hypothetical protein
MKRSRDDDGYGSRDPDLGVAARGRGGDCSGDAVCVLPNARPLRAPYQNGEGDGAHGQVLLVANAAVSGDQDLEAC